MRGKKPLRWLKLAFAIGITLLFGWLLFKQLDLQQATESVQHLSIVHLLAALLFLAAGYFGRIVRWWAMLRPLRQQLALSTCVRPFLGSIALNNVLPLRAGDLVRVFAFRAELRIPSAQLIGSLVIERLLDLLVLLALFFLGLLWLPDDALPEMLINAVTWLAALSIAGGILLILAAWRFASHHRHDTDRPPVEGIANIEHWLGYIGQSLDVLKAMRSVGHLLRLVLLSVIIWLLEGGVFVSIALALETGAPMLASWFALATGTLATLIPSAPGHLGTFDFFTAQAMHAYGAQIDVAAVFALVVHIVLWLPLTLVGLGLLLLGDRDLRALLRSDGE